MMRNIILLLALTLIAGNVSGAGSFVDTFHFGKVGTTSNVTTEYGDVAEIRWNHGLSVLEFTFDGIDYSELGTGGGGVPLMAQGSLLTSNGTSNGEFTACANDQIVVWDSNETAGFKCEAKPVVPVAYTPIFYTSTGLADIKLDTGVWVSVPNTSVSINPNGRPLEIGFYAPAVAQYSSISYRNSTASQVSYIRSFFRLVLGGSTILAYNKLSSTVTDPYTSSSISCSSVKFIYNTTATSPISLSIEAIGYSGTPVEIENCKMYVKGL